MRILIISQYFWPEEFRINELARMLAERGHHITVLTGIPNYPGGKFFPGYGFCRKRTENYFGVKIIRVPLYPRGKGGGISLALNYFSFALFASILGPVKCSESYDVIFVYEPSPITVGLPALVMKKIKLAPIAFWVQDLWPETLSATGAVKSESILKLVGMLVQFIYNNCDLILVQSKVFIDAIVKTGINNKKIKYFPNSAEEIFSHSQAMSELPENVKLPKGFRVMFAGNIGAAQDFETILSAAELLKKQKDIHWVIVGDGRMLPWVKEQIIKRQLSSNVHLLGRHPLQSMPAFFAQADVMLVTLRRELIFALTIPGKVQSYMAAGRPVIAALDGEGARVIEEAKAGFACPAESPDALANTVLKVYHMNPAEREQIASRGKEYFEQNFERNKLLDALENYLADLKVIKDKRCEL